ncbi:MAG: transglutaminase-like cysteine peptidase [Zoogloeaceae bacterium]|nr:transglutaminase-like cysteine peptidase [Zoogloeaceae bacterium]
MQQLARERYGAQTENRVADWRALLAETRELDVDTQLTRINTFFNRTIRFSDDIVVWQQDDYWASPLETMGRGSGDCEDFTIAKYTSLRLLGVPDEQLRLIYVRARLGGPSSTLSQAHMVLGYYPSPDAEPLILDNLIGDILPASRRSDLQPVFSFNSAGLWVGGASRSSADPTARLSRWSRVLERMRTEGITLPAAGAEPAR